MLAGRKPAALNARRDGNRSQSVTSIRSGKIWAGFVVLVIFAMLTAGCRVERAETPPPAAGETHWSYAGDTAPDRWGSLNEDYERCRDGEEQSPIDLSEALATAGAANIAFDYQPSNLAVVNNGHTIQVVYEIGSSISVDGEQYSLLQFHLHAGSEHTIDGFRHPLEMHFVHRNTDGNLAVVGVMIAEGTENSALEPVLRNMPPGPGEGPIEVDDTMINAGHMLPAERDHFEYQGSLTTPPCTEGVRWFVMADAVEMSASQISSFTALYSGNYRPIQPLNDRELRMTDVAESGR
jgi:carbonic anhydrase